MNENPQPRTNDDSQEDGAKEDLRFHFGVPIAVTVTLILLALALSAWAWFRLPADAHVPTHWGLHGRPDQWAGKTWGLLIGPLVLSVLLLLFVFIPRIEPRQFHFARSQKAYLVIWIGIIITMAGLHLASVMAALYHAPQVDRIVSSLVGIMLIVIGNYLGKIKSNFFMGIRTPWTLSSELSWRKTHRLGGILFVASGLVLVLSGVLVSSPAWAFTISIGFLIGSTLSLVVYSYLVWKTDPKKIAS